MGGSSDNRAPAAMADVRVVRHREFRAGYRELVLEAPDVAARVQPGQFIHLRVPRLEHCVLRRPFSVFDAKDGTIAVLYKPVGAGTQALTLVAEDERVNILGPLGNAFPEPRQGALPVLVAGGYGVAPLSFFASRCDVAGVAFIGAATEHDILCYGELASAGWDVRVSTDDGSAGVKGWVTVALDAWLAARDARAPGLEFYACGPDGMLRAVGERAMRGGWTAWLSLDKHMGCGMGACLACVQRLRGPDGTEAWGRVCKDGPIFEARRIVWS